MTRPNVHPLMAALLDGFQRTMTAGRPAVTVPPERPPVASRVYIPCPSCAGSGWVETGLNDLGVGYGATCRRCDGTRSIEVEIPVTVTP